jgi:hypothetical protein
LEAFVEGAKIKKSSITEDFRYNISFQLIPLNPGSDIRTAKGD